MVQHDVPLTALNTFGLPCVAERYLALTDPAQLHDPVLATAPGLVLGGGSNLLLRERVAGLTVHVCLGGVTRLDKPHFSGADAGAGQGREAGGVHLRVGAGVDWNQLVRHTLHRGWAGLENMILIPGTVGAAPVQNIGAYGSEVAEFITAVHVWEYGVGRAVLPPAACAFGYRDSRFKREPARYLITAVDLHVGRPDHRVRTDYGAIRAELARLDRAADPSAGDVALAVTNIRRSKLPDWFQLGNSGSFFKNPVVPRADHARLLADYPDLPSYPIDADHVKLPAGWLIDRAGLKGQRRGPVGTYARQALVIVNHGGATGGDVLAFSERIGATVAERFGVTLEREVRLVGQG